MKTIINKISLLILGSAIMFVASGCNDDNKSDLRLDGDTWISSFTLDDNYPGVIDRTSKTITVGVPEVYDTDAMTVTAIEFSDGAKASVKAGDVLNFSFPQVIKITNGDVFMDYTVNIKHDEAKILTFKLNDVYAGVIDHTKRSITVRVPGSVDVKNLVPVITTSGGAVVTPASGLAADFTNPVDFTVTYNTASAVYTVTVIPTDAPSAVYVGLAASMDLLNAEEKEAATWMLNNIANSQYVSFEDVQAGRVDLSECKIMWWHLHIDGGIDSMTKFDAAAPAAVNALVKMRELYNNGMNLLLTRYATFYAAKIGATLDGNNPNNCWGQSEETGEITGGPWSFSMKGHENHPLYQNLVMVNGETSNVYTCDTGYRITNSTAQWHIGSDWGGYADNEIWRQKTGGVDLGYGGDGAVVAWEYLPADTRGGIVCIGSGCYDWYAFGVDVSADKYHGNVARMTENAINYLMSK